MGCLIWLRQFLCLLFHLFLQVACSFPLSSNLSSPSHLCALDQSLALLQIKNSFMINTFSTPPGCENDMSNLFFEEERVPYPKTESWKEGTDCCSWYGVTCDMEKGHVIGLDLARSMLQGTLHPNSSLFFLRHLEKLDLSCNDFIGSHVSSHFGQLTSLKHLYLTNTNLVGRLPSEISHLSRLVSLDISQTLETDFILSMDERTFRKLAQNLTGLRELNLNRVNMSFSVPDSLMNLSSLTSIKLWDCGLRGRFPGKILGQPNLQLLDLSSNFDLTGTFPSSNMSTPLWYLDLSSTDFYVNLDIEFVNNHKSLKALHLSYTNVVKPNLDLLSNFTKLISLSLSSNELVGQLPSSIGQLKQLSYLILSNNSFSGQIPYEYGNFTKLHVLDLSSNNLFGQLPSSFGRFKQLQALNLQNNNFFGQIPREYGNLTELYFLDLSSNKLVGQLPSSFGRLKQLWSLHLENNNFFGQIPPEYGNLTELSLLSLSSNKLVGQLPSSFERLKHLRVLYLGNNNFFGQIPREYGNLTKLSALNLSSNQLSGAIPSSLFANHSLLKHVDLSQNKLHGRIPGSMFENVKLLFLMVSHNKLTGEVSSSICKQKSLQFLDLSNNSLSGFVPRCLGNFSNSLQVLKLNFNKFQGTIPAKFSEGNSLRYLNFNGNGFEGKLPESLVKCRNLEVLDIGNTNIESTFPEFLGVLPNLQVLVLRSNKLHGPLKCLTSNFFYSKLRIFDLSNNQLSGNLSPEFFNNLQAMMTFDPELKYLSYDDNGPDFSAEVTLKGVEIELVKIQNLLTILDLSGNKFTGIIPKTIGRLTALKQLNLSHNHLAGHILSSFGNLTNLESLDVSSNFLTGRIPVELVDLTFLAVLNLSNNQLEGTIPTGKQFNTFEASSFEGNIALCGFPLPKACNDKIQQDPKGSEESGLVDMDAFYLTFVVAFFGALLTLAAVLWINPYWRQAWFYFIEVCITTCFYFLIDNIPILSKFRYVILRF